MNLLVKNFARHSKRSWRMAMKSLSPTYAGSFGLSGKGRNLYPVALLSVLFCLVTMMFVAAPAVAQEATILGTVSDPTGAAVPNAAITITNNDTGVTRNLPSNND